MLVLTRRVGEEIIIADDIKIHLLEIKGDQVRIGIDAPKTMTVYRGELYRAIQQSNQEAVDGIPAMEDLESIIKSKKANIKRKTEINSEE